MSKTKKENKMLLVMILFLLVIDQVLKFFALKNNNLILINGILKIGIYQNENGNYGVNTNSTIMYVLTNLIIIVVAFKFITSQNQFVDRKTKVFLSLVIAGGVSNCIDRIFRGYVVEFIDFTDFIKLPIFNLADIYILIGWISMVAIFTVFTANEIKNRKKRKRNDNFENNNC